MKRTIYLLTIAFAMVMFITSSCSLLDIEKEFEIEIPWSPYDADPNLYTTYLLDAQESSSVIADYSDKIKSLEVTEASFLVTSFVATDGLTISNANLYVADANGSNQTLLAQEFMQKPQDNMVTPKVFSLEQAGLDKLENLLKNSPNQVFFVVSGTGSTAPIDFDFKVILKIKLTANPTE
jgi:hypothetical protein